MAKEILTTSIKIDRLIIKIAEGEIKVPPLQRSFVWKIDQIIKLLESIYHDYPIGSILLWETNDELPAARDVAGFKIPIKNPEYPHNYVLDGQQRISALYGVFCKNRTRGTQEEGYEINPEIFDMLFSLNNECFVHKNDKKEGEEYLEMKSLLDNIAFHKAIERLSEENKIKSTNLQSAFLSYEIPQITTKKRSREEVGIIFERINNSGTPLDLFDLLVAWTWTEGFHLQQKFSEIVDFLVSKNFEGIQKKIVLQCISAIIKESSKSKVIISLSPTDIRDRFDLLFESLKKTIDYLSTELSVKTIELLPHSHQIVPLCYFFSKVNNPNLQQKKAINEWFWKTSFSERYSASTDSHIDEDIASFKNLIDKNDYDAFKKLSYSISKEQLKTTKFIRTSAYSRAFIVLSSHKNPKELTNGRKIDVTDALSSFNKGEYHHIFPKDFLKSKGVDQEKINSLCNFCILPAASNKLVSNRSPSDYFKNIIPKSEFQEILESNIIPIKVSIYDKNDYDLFLNERSNKIMEYIDSLLI
jgi:hypothetical protein